MSEPSAFEQFLEARFCLLRDANPPREGEFGWRAVLSPEFLMQLKASRDKDGIVAVDTGQHRVLETIADVPFTVSYKLPPSHLAVIFCGREPFDRDHPERTVVIQKKELPTCDSASAYLA